MTNRLSWKVLKETESPGMHWEPRKDREQELGVKVMEPLLGADTVPGVSVLGPWVIRETTS